MLGLMDFEHEVSVRDRRKLNLCYQLARALQYSGHKPAARGPHAAVTKFLSIQSHDLRIKRKKADIFGPQEDAHINCKR
jgi:hypothetical protein